MDSFAACRARLALASGIASFGRAPAFGDFWALKSVYLGLLGGDLVDPGAALLSFALTWVIVSLAMRTIVQRHSRRYAESIRKGT